MKGKKILRVVTAAILISLLLMVIPAQPAQAGTISISPTTGQAGTTVTVTGTGFTPGTYILIWFNSSTQQSVSLMGGETTFSVYFTVPTSLAAGSYPIQAVDGATYTGLSSVVYFTIISAEISIDPDDGVVDTEVDIDGTNFGNSEDITVKYDSTEISIEDGDTDTSSSGSFSCTIKIPESAAGNHTITVSGDTSGYSSQATFSVDPEISFDPTSGAPKTTVSISGTGFDDNQDITITFGDTELSTSIETDSKGSFSGSFVVPTVVRATYKVKASDGSHSKSFDFAITAGASLANPTGNVGSELTVSGNGFLASGTITIKYDDDKIATATTDADGAFSATFKAPASEHGAHTINVSDGTNTTQLSFTMESEAPATPQPLLPLSGAKADAETYFDWADVEDSSGVTYTLQIASDKEFASIVLEKKGLTTSEYTLTKEQKLKSTKKDAPYYWRIQAVDGASNESAWTGAGSFYVGFQFPIPKLEGWMLYVAMGVGAFLFGLLGFWIGRRTSYYY